MTSIVETAYAYLRNTTKNVVYQKDLLEDVSYLTGYSKESVRGNVIKSTHLTSPRVLHSLGWKRCRADEKGPARFERLKRGEKPEFFQSYDCPTKHFTRAHVASFVKNKRSPIISTLGGHEGLCVRYFMSVFESPIITSYESDPHAAEAFRSLNLPVIVVESDYAEHLRRTGERREIDLLNLDLTAYLSGKTAADLRSAIEFENPKVIAITLQHSNRFRGGGKWVEDKYERYAHLEDKNRAALLGILPEYDMVSETRYKKSNVHNARKMRTFVFERRS